MEALPGKSVQVNGNLERFLIVWAFCCVRRTTHTMHCAFPVHHARAKMHCVFTPSVSRLPSAPRLLSSVPRRPILFQFRPISHVQKNYFELPPLCSWHANELSKLGDMLYTLAFQINFAKNPFL